MATDNVESVGSRVPGNALEGVQCDELATFIL